jgi:hypothetical protein
LDFVEAVDPYGGFLEEVIGVLADFVFFAGLGLVAADAVGMMGFIVQDEDVLLAADLRPSTRFRTDVSLSR